MIKEIFSILNWVKDKLPIPNRLEGIKNEISKLEKERGGLLNAKPDVKRAKRLDWIDNRLDTLRRMLANSTNSS